MQSPTRILLDLGAAMSVIRLRSLSDKDHKIIAKTESSLVSANGTPVDVRGQIKLVFIRSFDCEHSDK